MESEHQRTQSAFVFDDSKQTAGIAPAAAAEIPVGITSKAALLTELAQRLHFPDYFGMNWDALDECIHDLSWLLAGPIVLKHGDLPLANDIENAKTYLSILDSVVQSTPGPNAHSLVVAFPPETRERIAWLLRSAAYEQEKK
jgi:RNAse (barnase) inhibitor barstar